LASLLSANVHRTVEWTLTSTVERHDPWGEITLFAVLTAEDGAELRVPAFWDGGQIWRVRLSGSQPGKWQVRSECSDTADAGLHGHEAVLEIGPATADEANPLYRHGPVRIANPGKHFEHLDGTPFHWLADTWWMLMSERVAWPDGFKRLTDRRKEQGFTVMQTVVGFQPDTTPFDGRDANAGGSPWLPGYASINPGYFQAADRRLAHLVDAGIVPCILGGWGYHLLFMGKERMIAHWRYLVARYAAWPVIWCLAGEAAMPYYLSVDKAGDADKLRHAWPDIARAVRSSDPWHRLLTLHPRRGSWEDTTDPSTLDFHMTQAGHFPNAPRISIDLLAIARDSYPESIIINAEPPYEGHGGTNGPDVQRYSFWSSMLSGARGFTYGAAGVFQANDRDRPTGYRPDGGAFDAAFWDDAMMFPGGDQVAAGQQLLTSLHHHRFTPHPEWAQLDLRFNAEAYPIPVRAFAAGIPGECRLIYMPLRWYHWDGPLVRQLEPGVRYKAAYLETDTLRRHELGEVIGDAGGEWRGPTLPFMQDWLLLLQRA
jgi:hypothetical protein